VIATVEQMLTYLPIAAAMLATGAIGGVIAGLLGVGGGIVIVPVLEFALGTLGVDPLVRMHVAVATSLATIVPTSIASAKAHNARGSVDVPLAKDWSLPILLGAIAGTLLAAHVGGSVLSGVFAAAALLVALKMLLPLDHVRLSDRVPRSVPAKSIPFAIGGASSMMGIGGGTLSVPTMTLFNEPIHRAVGTSSLLGLIISVPATIGYMYSGYHHPLLPMGSIGYVNLIGFLFIGPVTLLTAPWGARIAHKLEPRTLAMTFGAFLLLVSARMAYRALGLAAH
jgi:uncharacterized protein